MSKTVLIKSYTQPPVNKKEVLRYAGIKQQNKELDALVDACINEAAGNISYKVCYCELDVKVTNDVCDFGEFYVCSKNLAKNLCGCKKVILFAATIGMEYDRLIARYSRIEPSKAFMLHALGAERVEALCDAFCSDIASKACTCPRFSPGYGDVGLCVQRDIFNILDCQKNIGVFLNDSLLMTPSKSVTAFVGIK